MFADSLSKIGFIGLSTVGLLQAHAQHLVINEILYNPDGADDGQEWIELCNPGDAAVDLSGWSLQNAGTSWSEVYVFDSESIEAGAYLVVGSGSDAVSFTPNLQNGGSSSDGIRLVDADMLVVDTVIYDSPNSNGLSDDLGAMPESTAPASSSGRSIGRYPDCTDSDDSGVDFQEFETPSPGEVNTGDGGSSGSCALGRIVINEFMANPSGSDADNEWVELYNLETEAVDLTGWALEYGTQSFGSSETLPDGLVIEAGGYVLLGGESVSDVDGTVSISLGNATSSVDGLRLVDCEGVVADTVVYGEPSDSEDSWEDDTGEAESFAPAPADGASTGRVEDGLDTDLCGTDFVVQDIATPGRSNTEVPDCEGSDDLKINEFLANPDGDDGGNEWVELYNIGSQTIDLDGWQLQWGTSSWNGSLDFVEGDAIAPGEFLLIGGDGVVEADIVDSLGLGNGSDGDGLRLLHCGGGPSDTVIYGGSNEDGWTDDTGAVATSVAPSVVSGVSLGRCVDGEDSGESGVDWVVSEESTPGEANEECVPVECVAGSLTIKINEIFPNPEGSDADQEWVELYNAGEETQSLDGWVIEQATSSWSTAFVFPGGVDIAPGEFLLVGGSEVPDATIASSLSLGNASTAPDGLRLVDCSDQSTVQDTILWGDWGAEAEDPIYDDVDGQGFGLMPEDGQSLGRFPDGLDSDDSSEDFRTNMTPTPGRANEEGGGSGGGGSSDPDIKQCGDRTVDENPDTKKCGMGSGARRLGLSALLMAGLAVFRRRKVPQ